MLKALTFLLGCLPLAFSLYQIYLLQSGGGHSLGADPGKALVQMQGEWTLRFLMLTLLVSPIRQLSPFKGAIRIRRMLGLFTFFYASLHLLSYSQFLLLGDLSGITADIAKRPYITVGFAAFLLLVPLALTSTDGMMRRLRRNWGLLHRAIYIVAILAIVHITWIARSSYAEALFYGLLLLGLLGFRAWRARNRLFQKVPGRQS